MWRWSMQAVGWSPLFTADCEGSWLCDTQQDKEEEKKLAEDFTSDFEAALERSGRYFLSANSRPHWQLARYGYLDSFWVVPNFS